MGKIYKYKSLDTLLDTVSLVYDHILLILPQIQTILCEFRARSEQCRV